MSRQKVDSEMITSIAASKLSGALPALDGSALTGIAGMLKGASDPVVTTNPAGGVGSVYLNTADGEMFCCTDATTDNNIWKNIGAGSGAVAPFFYPGATSIYGSGTTDDVSGSRTNIEKFAIATDGNMADVGTLAAGSIHTTGGGSKSDTHAYVIGGHTSTVGTGHPWYGDGIQKYSFAAGVQNGSTIGLTSTSEGAYRMGFSDGTYAYTAGRYTVLSGVEYNTNTIERFNTSTEAAIEDHGDLSLAISVGGFHSSVTHGYTVGGEGTPGGSNWFGHIDKFAFASNITALSHGTLAPSRGTCSSYNSETTGYVAGGRHAPNPTAVSSIDKFLFSSNTTTTDCGNLSTNRAYMGGGGSGEDFGYTMGGSANSNGSGQTDVMEKQQFSNDTTIQNIGNLTSTQLMITANQI